jgi:methionine synthase II (cobalamin-independent)
VLADPTPASLDGLRPATATHVGSLPGTRVRDAVALVAAVLGEDDGLPHLPELPARGPGSDLVGRTAGLLAAVSPDLAVETTPSGWRFADAPGRDVRRATSWLGEDLDAWEEALGEHDGTVAASLAGPWTLLSSIELRGGERALRDPGACRDVGEAVALAARDHVAELRRRLPRARHTLWLDEPTLPAVLAGAVPTASGRHRHGPVEPAVADAVLRPVVAELARLEVPLVVHCCAPRPPYAVLAGLDLAAVAVDLGLHRQDDDEAVGELLDRGTRLVAGVVPTGTGAAPPSDVRASVALVRDLGHRLGFSPEDLASRILVSPACGLAGWEPAAARSALEHLRAVGRGLREEEGGGRGA